MRWDIQATRRTSTSSPLNTGYTDSSPGGLKTYSEYSCGLEVEVGIDGTVTDETIESGPSLETAVTIVNWKSKVTITKTREHDTEPPNGDDVDATFVAYNATTGTLYGEYTTSGGTCEIIDLAAGTYYLYEVAVQDGYYLEDQEGYLETGGSGDANALDNAGYTSYVYCGTFTLCNDGSYQSKAKEISVNTSTITTNTTYTQITITLTNKTGKLVITKEDDDGEDITITADFVLVYTKDGDDYEFVIDDEDYEDDETHTYDSTYDENTCIYTTENNEITLDYLKEGTYYIIEIAINDPAGYLLSYQDGYMGADDDTPDGLKTLLNNYFDEWVNCRLCRC